MSHNFIKWKSILSILFIGGLPLMFYQNCGQNGLSSMNDGSESIATTKANAVAAAAPFAFDTKADTISYNSCFSPNSAGKSGFFTLKIGSHTSNTGIRVNGEFLKYAKQVLKPSYPENEVTSDQVSALLKSSTNNKDATPEFAIRRQKDLAIYLKDSATPVNGSDFIFQIGTLTSSSVSTTLMSGAYSIFKNMAASDTVNPAYSNYFPFASTGVRNIAGTFAWATSDSSSEGKALTLRNYFNSDALLTLTYGINTVSETNLTENTKAYKPLGQSETDLSKAYGTAYKLSFSKEIAPKTLLLNGLNIGSTVSPYAYLPENILSEVQEVDLLTGAQTTSTWSCDQLRRYLVVRQSDRATYCPNESFDNIVGNANYSAELNVVRRHFPADQWDVNISQRCVVPKDTTADCYNQDKDSSGNLLGVEYDQTKACFQGLEGMPYGSSIPTKLCAQYVSICVRN